MKRLFIPVLLIALGMAGGLWLGRRTAPQPSPPPAPAPVAAPEPTAGPDPVATLATVSPASATASPAAIQARASEPPAVTDPAPPPVAPSPERRPSADDPTVTLDRLLAESAGLSAELGAARGRAFDAGFALNESRRGTLGLSVIETERLRAGLSNLWQEAQAITRANVTGRETLPQGETRVTIEHHAEALAPLRQRADALLESVDALDAEARAQLTLELDQRFNDWGAGTRVITVTPIPALPGRAEPYYRVKEEISVKTPGASRTRVMMRTGAGLPEEYRALLETSPASGTATLELAP